MQMVSHTRTAPAAGRYSGQPPADGYASREEVIEALMALRPANFATLHDGAQFFEIEIPWQLAGGIVRHLNTSNIRRMNYADAAAMADDMTGGLWGSCYDNVIFTDAWVLYNGQHRMMASWRSRRSYHWCVIFSGRPDVRRSCDGGKKRTITQTHGLGSSIASVVGVTMALEARSARDFTRPKKLQRYERDPGTFEHFASRFNRIPVLRESHLGAAFAFAEIHRPLDASKIRELADDLATDQLTNSSRLIAKQIVDRRSLGAHVHSMTARTNEAAMFLRAIQAHLLGADLARLESRPETLDWFDSPKDKQ